jgi:hypothetical protein
VMAQGQFPNLYGTDALPALRRGRKPVKKLKKTNAHPGFNAVKNEIAEKEGVPAGIAAKMLAGRTRAASPAAKAANPRLKRVRG